MKPRVEMSAVNHNTDMAVSDVEPSVANEARGLQTQDIIDSEFRKIWETNFAGEGTSLFKVGCDALRAQHEPSFAEEHRSTVFITDVTLRDGEQQRIDNVTPEQRIEVFDHTVSTGVGRVEIGHLGNAVDQDFARKLVRHIAEQEKTNPRYGEIKLQVLFGSQTEIIEQGTGVLREAFQEVYGDNWERVMADRVVVHVYDRIHEELSGTSSQPYTPGRAAERVVEAAKIAQNAGFKHFSVSGEAATATTPEVAIQFYRSVMDELFRGGAETINVNLANTYGYSPYQFWNTETLIMFNAAVKHGYKQGAVTTTIHTHNDVNNAADQSVRAIIAGFDGVEGTLIGMGERVGNACSIDVIARVLEAARHKHEIELTDQMSRMAEYAGRFALARTVTLAPELIDNLHNTYAAAQAVAKIYGEHAQFRFEHSFLGNPYQFDNGSGPHDQALAAAVMRPNVHHPYQTYEWSTAVAALMGNELAARIAVGDLRAAQEVTVGGHAGGRKTRLLLEGDLPRTPTREETDEAQRQFTDYLGGILQNVRGGVVMRV